MGVGTILDSAELLLVANGDLRLSANQNCWPAQDEMEQALAQQTGQKGLGMKMDPRMHPKFQEEWSKVKADLDGQYNQVMQQHKELVAQRFSVTL